MDGKGVAGLRPRGGGGAGGGGSGPGLRVGPGVLQ